jgi:PTS system mannose-specific IIC component
MTVAECLLAGLIAVICGLDRMALCQFMISRPIVAGPLAGFFLGEPLLGLQVGMLTELLWLGRLPVGANIPPDDTQIAVGGTFLATYTLSLWSYPEPVNIAIGLLLAIPLAKSGQLFDHMARRANDNLGRRVERFLQAGELGVAESSHLIGLGHFVVSTLCTFIVVAGVGSLLCSALVPIVAPYLEPAGYWLLLVFPLIGAAMILRSIKIHHSMTLFGASFVSALLILWLL